jgi:hypothetical protein
MNPPTTINWTAWTRFFYAAAAFNYVIGFPVMLARVWSYNFVYLASVSREPMALRLWADFGFFVVLIGFGYQMIAHNIGENRGIVWLGVFAKLFDVFNLTNLYLTGQARALVLAPAAIDAAFTTGFLIFLSKTRNGLAPQTS